MTEDQDCREAVSKLLQSFTYKPGWTFYVEADGLIIDALVIDSDNLEKTIRVQFGVSIPFYADAKFPWDRWLLDQIKMVEDHEAREFFKINGVKVFDPHGKE